MWPIFCIFFCSLQLDLLYSSRRQTDRRLIGHAFLSSVFVRVDFVTPSRKVAGTTSEGCVGTLVLLGRISVCVM